MSTIPTAAEDDPRLAVRRAEHVAVRHAPGRPADRGGQEWAGARGLAWARGLRNGTGRSAFGGVARIVRFNWPLYVAGASGFVFAGIAAWLLPVSAPMRAAILGAAGLSGFWTLSSLVASWVVYDGSTLMTGTWLLPLLERRPASWIAISAGFDEFTPGLRRLLPESESRAFDVYDPAVMTEASIARARATPGSVDATPADLADLPVETASVDAVVLALSAHELRTPGARRALFREARRVLTPNGRIVVAEHLRNVANVVAFGPGALHFHSRRTWVQVFAESGLTICREQSITPLIRLFALRKSS